jgi:hypothetical protein
MHRNSDFWDIQPWPPFVSVCHLQEDSCTYPKPLLSFHDTEKERFKLVVHYPKENVRNQVSMLHLPVKSICQQQVMHNP